MKVLFELSRSRHKILDEIENNRYILINHLFKVYYMRDNDSFDHWIHEIYGFYPFIQKMKSNNKHPKSSLIYKSIFGSEEDIFSSIFMNNYYKVRYEYKVDIDKSTEDDFHKFVSDYVKWLSNELSSKGSTSPHAVYNKIIELLGDE